MLSDLEKTYGINYNINQNRLSQQHQAGDKMSTIKMSPISPYGNHPKTVQNSPLGTSPSQNKFDNTKTAHQDIRNDLIVESAFTDQTPKIKQRKGSNSR